jgi:raffinose/stachyose/melibiose transport system permease protein
MTRRNRFSLTKITAVVTVGVWALMVIIPLAIMVAGAVKSPDEMAVSPFGWPQQFHWETFAQAWTDANLGRGLRNSLFLTAASLVLIVFFGASAAYPLARRTHWSPVLYYFLAGIMVPFQLAMLPLYRLMKLFHLINTFQGVIFIYTAVSLPMVIFLYTGFIKGVNRELEEAALVDGAGPFRTFWSIIFPLLKPVTATVIILNVMSLWNDFFIALLFLPKKELRTLQLSIFSFVGQYNSKLNLVMAAVILSILPLLIVFLLLQKQFIKGLAGGAIKG